MTVREKKKKPLAGTNRLQLIDYKRYRYHGFVYVPIVLKQIFTTIYRASPVESLLSPRKTDIVAVQWEYEDFLFYLFNISIERHLKKFV